MSATDTTPDTTPDTTTDTAADTAADDLTVSVNGGPAVPMADLERVGKQLPLFEGARWPDASIALTGGMSGEAEFLLPDLLKQKIGSTFAIVVHGIVVSKKHQLKTDKDGEQTRQLVVTLKVDNIDPLD